MYKFLVPMVPMDSLPPCSSPTHSGWLAKVKSLGAVCMDTEKNLKVEKGRRSHKRREGGKEGGREGTKIAWGGDKTIQTYGRTA